MFGKAIEWIYSKYKVNEMKKQQDKQVVKLTEKKKEFVKEMKALYAFVKWLNTQGLKNRKERKTFWKSISEGQLVMETTLQNLINQYDAKPDVEESDVSHGKCGHC